MLPGVQDQVAVALDRLGELDERGQQRTAGPRQLPASKSLPRLALGGEHRPQLLLEQVRPVERLVGDRDLGLAVVSAA